MREYVASCPNHSVLTGLPSIPKQDRRGLPWDTTSNDGTEMSICALLSHDGGNRVLVPLLLVWSSLNAPSTVRTVLSKASSQSIN